VTRRHTEVSAKARAVVAVHDPASAELT